MKKKLATAAAIVVVAVMMIFLPPPEWAAAQGPSQNSHIEQSPVRVCLRYLEQGNFALFGGCIANFAKRGEL